MAEDPQQKISKVVRKRMHYNHLELDYMMQKSSGRTFSSAVLIRIPRYFVSVLGFKIWLLIVDYNLQIVTISVANQLV